MLPGARADRAFQSEPVAHLQGCQNTLGKQSTTDLTNMKHTLPLVLCRQIGHGETAAIAIIEAKSDVLAGAYLKGLSGQQDQFDNIHTQCPLADHPCADVPHRRVQRPTGYFQAHVATGMALAQQHLVRRQRVARGWRVWRELLCAVVT